MSGLWVVGGLIALMIGARLLVDGAVSIARGYGISEAFIGLTIVAVGTSLPELATSLIAAFRRQSEIAIGNIVGSNIFNVLGILGLTAVIAPVPVAPRFLSFDLPILIAVSLVLTLLLLTRPVIGRALLRRPGCAGDALRRSRNPCDAQDIDDARHNGRTGAGTAGGQR